MSTATNPPAETPAADLDAEHDDTHEHEHGADCEHHHHGEMPFVRESPKVGRNDACPCGSGKKFKKCCG